MIIDSPFGVSRDRVNHLEPLSEIRNQNLRIR